MKRYSASSLESYVPDSFFREGKEELAGRECREDFCLINPSDKNRILAARGAAFEVGKHLEIASSERSFVLTSLSSGQTVACLCSNRPMILFPALLQACGLIPVLLPHGKCEDVAICLRHMNRSDLLFSPALSEVARHGRGDEALYRDLCEQMTLCDRILSPDRDDDFRLHSAYVALFSGFRADVTTLPIGAYPVSDAELKRWTAFLLCTLLSLRTLSTARAHLALDGATRSDISLRLTQSGVGIPKGAPTERIFSYLSLPAFSDFRLLRTDGGLLLEIKLRRHSAEPLLRAFPEEFSKEVLCLEIRFA